MSLLLGPDRLDRWVLVEGGAIADTGTGALPPLDLSAVERVGCAGGLIQPGAVNAHTHLYSGLAPLGMPAPEPPPGNFVQILERVWWRLDRALDEATLRASARLYVAEALLAGTVGLVDHHESPAFIEGSLTVLADACDELGMRAALCYGATERNHGRDEASRGLAECARLVEGPRRPLVRGLVGLHASFTVSDETIRDAGALCQRLGTVLHVHVAEDGADVEDARRRGYAGPLERLDQLGALLPGSVLAHGVHLEAAQVERAAELGCWLVQNPRSNKGNRVGYPRWLGRSELVALGTDGYPANMADEEAALQREAAENGESSAAVWRRPAASRELLAEIFDLPTGLEVGAAADLVVADPKEKARHVLVDGRLVVRDGQLTTGDIATIRGDAEAHAAQLWERMRGL
jgi:cytosine/adenosine deaminase-related metal-dependent hydrolase